MNEAAEVVTSAADGNANVIFGAVIDESLGDEVRVTVIATGFGGAKRRRRVEATQSVRLPTNGEPLRASSGAHRRGARDPVLPARRGLEPGSRGAWRAAERR